MPADFGLNGAMKMPAPARLLALLLIIGSGLLPRPSDAGSPTARSWHVSDDLQVEQLSPDVWMHTSWATLANDQRYPANGLIVRDGDALMLVDTAWGVEPTRALLDWIEDELRLPVRQVVSTHFHDDRIGGWPALAERDIPLLLAPLTRALAAGEHIDATLGHALDGITVGTAVTVGPIEVFYPGPGHSPDNVVVWIPDAQMLAGGCAVKASSATALGNTADADLKRWPEAIRRIQQRYPQVRTVVPVHYAPGGPELLDHTLALLGSSATPR